MRGADKADDLDHSSRICRQAKRALGSDLRGMGTDGKRLARYIISVVVFHLADRQRSRTPARF